MLRVQHKVTQPENGYAWVLTRICLPRVYVVKGLHYKSHLEPLPWEESSRSSEQQDPLILAIIWCLPLNCSFLGAPGWLSSYVKCPTLAQVMISWFMSSSTASDSAVSAEPALDLLSLSLSLCPSPTHALSKYIQTYIHTYIHTYINCSFLLTVPVPSSTSPSKLHQQLTSHFYKSFFEAPLKKRLLMTW